MKSTVLLVILAVIVIAALAVYAFRVQAPTHLTPTTSPDSTDTAATEYTTEDSVIANASPSMTTTSPNPELGATIVIDDTTGFQPSSITVPVNTTVSFSNHGQQLHWPASDPHPIHTDLNGFDAKHGLQPGETYQYTFTKAGTWKFHDHLHTNFTGQVIVQ